jgi:hypothetical protein
MTEAEWLACEDPISMLSAIDGKASGRKFRLYACACCRALWSFLVADSCRRAVEVGEGLADDAADIGEADAARASAGAVRKDYLSTSRRRYRSAATGCVFPDAVVGAVIATRSGAHVEPVRQRRFASLIRDIFGNPFRQVAFSPEWRTDTTVTLARATYDARDFSAMPRLADALQDAGCDSDDVLNHCRGPGPHVRGCWVVDLVLRRE